MPSSMRNDVAIAFVEPWAHFFGCCVEKVRSGGGPQAPCSPRVHLGNLRTTVEYAAAVYRVPKDPSRARLNHSEGPAMAIQCRTPATFSPITTKREGASFQAEADPTTIVNDRATESTQAAAFDLLREVAAMLAIAQERAREGATELTPGVEGRPWWANAPRFNGSDGAARGTPLVYDHDRVGILGHLSVDHQQTHTSEHAVGRTWHCENTSTDELHKEARVSDGRASLTRPVDGAEHRSKRRNIDCNRQGSEDGSNGQRTRSQPSVEQRTAAKRALLRRAWQAPQSAWNSKITYARVGRQPDEDNDVVRCSLPQPAVQHRLGLVVPGHSLIVKLCADLHDGLHASPPCPHPLGCAFGIFGFPWRSYLHHHSRQTPRSGLRAAAGPAYRQVSLVESVPS